MLIPSFLFTILYIYQSPRGMEWRTISAQIETYRGSEQNFSVWAAPWAYISECSHWRSASSNACKVFEGRCRRKLEWFILNAACSQLSLTSSKRYTHQKAHLMTQVFSIPQGWATLTQDRAVSLNLVTRVDIGEQFACLVKHMNLFFFIMLFFLEVRTEKLLCCFLTKHLVHKR
jgi:hypothetical protein